MYAAIKAKILYSPSRQEYSRKDSFGRHFTAGERSLKSLPSSGFLMLYFLPLYLFKETQFHILQSAK